MTMSKKRVFVRNDDGEGSFYCGDLDDREQVRSGIGAIVMAELDDLIGGYIDRVSLDFIVKEMTDEEVAALPEL
jgi:hypothetical protein